MDLDNRSCYEPEIMEASPPSNSGETKKLCSDCNTTRTPCWRSGPAGPRSLCNACGIRYRKKKRALLGMEKGVTVTKSRSKISKSKNGSGNLSVSLKMGLMSFGRERVLVEDEWKRKLGEVERAAMLLMALSGSAYA